MQVLVLGKNRFGVLKISHLAKDGFQSNFKLSITGVSFFKYYVHLLANGPKK